MEAWIAELEMKWDKDLLLDDELKWGNIYNKDENEGVVADAIFGELLAAFLGEDFPHSSSYVSKESKSFSPTDHPLDQFDHQRMSCEAPSVIINNMHPNFNVSDCGDRILPDHQLAHSNTEVTVIGGRQSSSSSSLDLQNNDRSAEKKKDREDSKQQKEGGALNRERPKRRRQPSQVQDHIITERKRRELLTRQFIALSAIVPGLKKTDKTSVLGEAIKYLQNLKEKVKALEDMVATQTVESMVVVKKSQIVIDKNDPSGVANNSTDPLSYANCIINNDNYANESLPQIEVKVSDKTLLFKVFCEKHDGILPKLFSEVEKHSMTVVSANIIPFGALALDITILAQMEMGFDKKVEEIIRGLHSTLQL